MAPRRAQYTRTDQKYSCAPPILQDPNQIKKFHPPNLKLYRIYAFGLINLILQRTKQCLTKADFFSLSSQGKSFGSRDMT